MQKKMIIIKGKTFLNIEIDILFPFLVFPHYLRINTKHNIVLRMYFNNHFMHTQSWKLQIYVFLFFSVFGKQ